MGLFTTSKETSSFPTTTIPAPTASTPLQPGTPSTTRLRARSPILPSHPSKAKPPQPQLSQAELIEIRALQRTFEGAYTRTALSQFSFSLLVLKIFTHEFYSVGALFAGFGVCVFGVSVMRRKEGNRQFFVEKNKESVSLDNEQDGVGERRFRTSGNVVCVVTVVSVCAYVTLLVLVLRVGK